VHGLEIRTADKIHRLVLETLEPTIQADAVMAHPLYLTTK
jgi:hypothetical protein